MASAIIKGLIKKGVNEKSIFVIDPKDSVGNSLFEYGVHFFTDSTDFPKVDVLILAVKPNHVEDALRGFSLSIDSDTLVISVVAGMRIKNLQFMLNNHSRLVRVMPNLPALVRKGFSGYYAGENIHEGDIEVVEDILGAVGESCRVDSEHLLDAITALSGSGPAYVYYLMEQIERIAIAMGIEKDAARALTLQTFLGSALLATESNESPQKLSKNVTSKAGTTEKAIEKLDSSDIKSILEEAVLAARERASEIGDSMKAHGDR